VLRNATKYDLKEFIEINRVSFQGINPYNVELYMDAESEKQIFDFLEENGKKFKMIIYEITQGRYKEGVYEKVEVSEKASNVTEMIFKGISNTRIYCKEFFLIEGKKIVMIHYLGHKNFQKANRNKLKGTLEKIGGYQYGFRKR
jgi:hypothetical protein